MEINDDTLIYVLLRPVYNSDFGVRTLGLREDFFFFFNSVKAVLSSKFLTKFCVIFACVYTLSVNVQLKQKM